MDVDDFPAIASKQLGLWTAPQARAEGWSARQVTRRLSAGRWQYVAGRAMAVRLESGNAWSALQLAVAARLTLPNAVVSHRTAALIHGLPLRSDAASRLVDVTTKEKHSHCRSIVVHQLRLGSSDVVGGRCGIRVTSRRRTAVDMLSTLPMTEAVDLWAWVSSRRVLDVATLRTVTDRRWHWYGRRQLLELVELVGGGAVNGAEVQLHRLLDEAGLTGWQASVEVRDARGIIGIVDVLFAGARVVVELDGFGAHTSRTSFVNDRRRQNRLVAAGYTVLRFSWDDVAQRPGDLVRLVRAAVVGAVRAS